MATPTIDFSPLTDPITRDQVNAWKAQAKASGAPWSRWGTDQIVRVAIVAVVGVVFVVIFGSFAATLVSSQVNGVSFFAGSIPTVVIIGAVIALIFGVRRVGNGHAWEIWTRMDGFAKLNGLIFSPRDENPSYPGQIFQLGTARAAINHVQSATGRFFDIGNYDYTTGSGKNQSTHHWGFMAFNLDRKLPNMVLDAKSNNSFFGSNLPATFSKDQILHLEGDFDQHFTLYCPREYERDALYIFTPDLMALLIDNASTFDVEVIDDWMFVYSSTQLPVASPGLYQRMFHIIDTVGAKALTQTDRYVDDRIGDFSANIVAPQGARLKRGVSVFSIIVGVIAVGFWIWSFIGDGIDALTP